MSGQWSEGDFVFGGAYLDGDIAIGNEGFTERIFAHHVVKVSRIYCDGVAYFDSDIEINEY